MEQFLPILILVALFFLMRYFKTKFRKLHFLLLIAITLYFLYTGITSEEKRYFSLFITLLGAGAVYSTFRELKGQQPKS